MTNSNNKNREIVDRDLTDKLQELMYAAGINSFRKLYKLTGTSERTIKKLRAGDLNTLQWQTLVKISDVLQINVGKTIEIFGKQEIATTDRQQLERIDREYQQLQQQLQQQRTTLQAEFQTHSLQVLESFLTYFPTAKQAAANNPNFPASKILPLLQPIDRLIQQWGVVAIGEVGAKIAYDPRWHQLIEGTASAGDVVTVRFVGYRQDEKLIFRAKVSRGNS